MLLQSAVTRPFFAKQWRSVAKRRNLSPTFVRKYERSVLFDDQAESSRVGQRNCFARKKNETGTINSGSSRVDICTAVLQRYIALATTDSFGSCSVLPPSPHATLRSSHRPNPASIFSTVFRCICTSSNAVLVSPSCLQSHARRR